MDSKINPFKKWKLANAAFVFAMIILLVIGTMTYRSMRSTANADQWEIHSYLVIQEIDGLLSSIKDAETGQRGFIISGDEQYLEPYLNSIKPISEKQASLRNLTRDNPGQQGRLNLIDSLIEKRLNLIKRSVELRKEKGFAAAAEFVLTHQGKVIMDQLRDQMPKLRDEELRLLQIRQDKKGTNAATLIRMLIFGGIFSLSILILIFISLKLNISHLSETDQELRRYQGHLNELVSTRTAELKEEIIGHKEALSSLGLSEERYRGLFNSLLEGFCIVELIFDTDGHPIDYRFLEINPVFEAQTGLHEAEGKLMSELAPKQEKYWYEIYGKVALSGQPVQFENEAGELNRWFDVSAFRVGGEESRKVAICFNDITVRKQAEEALAKSEHQFRLLFETMPTGVVIQDSDGTIISMNDAAEAILGKTREEFLFSSSVKVEHDTIREDGSIFPGVEHPAMISLHTGEILKNVVMGVYNPRMNNYRWVNIDSIPLFFSGESKPSQVYTIFTDITERKRAEEELRKSEERFYKAFYFGPLGINIFSLSDGRSSNVNEAFLKLTGYSYEEVIGHTAGELNLLVNPEDRTGWTEKLKSGESIQNLEVRLRQKSGQIVHALFSLTKIEVNGEQMGLIQAVDITERILAEEVLKENEAKYRGLFENSIDAILITTPDGRIEEANPEACHMFGMTKEELTFGGKAAIMDLSDPLIHNALEERSKTGRFRGELNLRRKDGTIFPADDSNVQFTDKQGNVKSVMILRDITERKKSEEELRDSERRYSALFANKINGMAHCRILTNEEGKPVDYIILQINEAYERIIGVKKADVEGRNVLEVFPDIQNYAIDYIGMYGKIALENGEIRFEEYFEATGQYLSIYAYCPIPGEFIAIFTDVTERKKAENVSAFQARLLSEVNDAVFSSDKNFRITYWNKAAEKMFGWTKEEALGNVSGELLKPNTEGSTLEEVRAKLQKDGFWEGEGQYMRKDGTYFFVEVNSKTLKDADGEYIGQLVVARDITERKQAGKELRESEERFRSTLDHMIEGAQIIGRDWRYIYINDVAEKHNRRPKEELLGRRYMDMWPGIESTYVFEVIKRCMEEKIFDYFEYEFTFPDGTTGWFELSIEPVPEGVFILSMDITERKQADKTLKDSEERFRVMANSMPQLAWIANTDGYIFWYNQGWYEYTGTTPEEMEGWGWQSVHHPETLPVVMEKWKDSLATQEPFEMVFPLLGKDGIYRSFLTRGLPMFNNEGELMQWFGTNTDVSLLEEAEKALRESEIKASQRSEELEMLMNTVPSAIWVAHDPLCREITGNKTANEFYEAYEGENVSAGPELGLPIPPRRFFRNGKELMAEELTMQEATTTGKDVRDSELEVLLPSGKWMTMLGNATPLKDGNGQVRGCIGAFIDITERKTAEQRLKEAQDKLNLVLDNGHVGIWERDLKAGTLLFDKRMERMFGIEEGTFEGTFEAFQNYLVEEDITHVKEAVRKAVEEDVPIDTVYRVRLANGKINHINSKGFVIQKEYGKAVKIAGVCFDITNMQEGAEQTLFKLNEELLRSNRELAQFAYVASHDLQEPLKTVSTFTQLLAARYKDKLDDHANQFIHYTVEAASRMQVLINDLLSYSRIGSKGQKMEAVDANNVLSNAMLNLEVSIREKDAEITWDELPVVVGDEGQLVQLMQNLVGNALKYCEVTPRVHVSAKEETDDYVFSVKDNGIGIERQYADKIFLIFQRLVGKHEYSGSGIGLALCKRIVERHGGKIWFESEPGEGTTFFFTIPKKNSSEFQVPKIQF